MKKTFLLLLISLSVFACTKVPITGRKQIKLLPKSTLNEMSFSSYQEFMSGNALSKNANQVAMVQRVGKNIQLAVENYFQQTGQAHYLKGYAWEFNLVEDNLVNAWAMPGGKTVVYTGILPITKNEDGLAVVMGHEIAHAIANHGNERMSQGLVAEMGGLALAVALSEQPEETQNLLFAVAGAGTQVGIMLPFSRMHESEADEMGLYFMAMAGYNPEEAAPFWGRMAAMSKGQAPPEFLSTHPSHDTRIQKLNAAVPKAKEMAIKYKVKY